MPQNNNVGRFVCSALSDKFKSLGMHLKMPLATISCDRDFFVHDIFVTVPLAPNCSCIESVLVY
jgi:hypothetical protein